MKAQFGELVFISDNRLLAEATCAALVSEGVVSSYVHLRNCQQNEFWNSVRQAPTVVVLEIEPSAVQAELFSRIRRIAEEFPGTRIVPIGDGRCAAWVASCIESGASTFVFASESLKELAATIGSLKVGGTHSSPAVAQAVLQRLRELSSLHTETAGEGQSGLTPREIEVLELVERGMLNKEIARRLKIAISTVKNHLHAVFEKLEVDGRRQAVRQALATGILQPPAERVA